MNDLVHIVMRKSTFLDGNSASMPIAVYEDKETAVQRCVEEDRSTPTFTVHYCDTVRIIRDKSRGVYHK